jgi:hypothetical protein
MAELQLPGADLGEQVGGDGVAHPGEDAFWAGDCCQFGDESFDAHIGWCVGLKDLLEVTGEDAAGAVAPAQAFGFASAVVAFHVVVIASAIAAEGFSGHWASGKEAIGAAEPQWP